jgi:hypothetical protein
VGSRRRVPHDGRGPTSPLTYGYDSELGVYFNSGPVLSVAGDPAPQCTPGDRCGRDDGPRIGRGGIDEQDITAGPGA